MRLRTTAAAMLSLLFSSFSVAQVLEIGQEDFAITAVGTPGDTSVAAFRQEVAYNSTDDEYLIVYSSLDGFGPTAEGEEELWGQRVSAQGELLGGRVLLTDIGGLGTAGPRLFNYQIAYIAARNDYFLSYNADDPDFPMSSGLRVFGVILDETGIPQGGAVQLTPGGDGDFRPHFAYNTVDDEIMVTWSRADAESPAAIFVRVISAVDGAPTSVERRVNLGDSFSSDPVLGHDPLNNQYLLYWRRNENQAPMVQLLDAAGLTLLPSDRELATSGFRSSRGNIAFDPNNEEFLVIWTNSDPAFSSMSPDSYEIFGRRIDSNGQLLGADKFRISTSSDVFNPAFGANADCATPPCRRTARPGLGFSIFDQAFIASWTGTVLQTNSAQVMTNQSEAFVRVLPAGQDASSMLAQQQISNVGGDEFGPQAFHATVAAADNGRYLAAWWGDDNRHGSIPGEIEIFGQLLLSATLDTMFGDSFESAP